VQIRKLFFREGKSDKVYIATLNDGGTVTFQWGRRGASLQSKTFGPMSQGAAMDFWSGKVQEKLNKGYRNESNWNAAQLTLRGFGCILSSEVSALFPASGVSGRERPSPWKGPVRFEGGP
jgi:predicted DNA-binding WGR domain protein